MNDETAALADTVRRMLASRLPATTLVAGLGAPAFRETIDAALDREIGLAGLLLSEEDGGAGGTLADASAVAYELGLACAPSNFVTSTVLAAPLLAALGKPGPEDPACLAVPWAVAPHEHLVGLRMVDGRVTGSVKSVAGVAGARVLIVPVEVDGVTGLAAVDARAGGVSRQDVVSLDQTRPVSDLVFDDAEADLLASGSQATAALSAALQRTRAVLASEQAGLAAWCLRETVEHVMQRRQFGRLIGSFQSLKHRLAYAWIDVQSAAVAADEAADDGRPDHDVLVAVAQSACSEIAFRVAEECVQMHGGIGMTWEHPAHVYLKRALVGVTALGSPDQHRAALAELVDLPA